MADKPNPFRQARQHATKIVAGYLVALAIIAGGSLTVSKTASDTIIKKLTAIQHALKRR